MSWAILPWLVRLHLKGLFNGRTIVATFVAGSSRGDTTHHR